MKKLKTTGKIYDTVTGYDFRFDKPLSRTKAIRLKCVECQGGNRADTRRCDITDCTLWPYRHGTGSLAKNARISGDSDEDEENSLT